MEFPELTPEKRLESLKLPSGKIDMVLDTDTYNEVDDQFALAYALKSSKKLNLKAVYAAPFHNDRSKGPEDGMEKSYQEIINIMKKLDISPEGRVYKGAKDYLKKQEKPRPNEATEDLIKKAKSSKDKLYVVAIGAITNVASAIRQKPEIIKDIVVIWLGGHAYHWPHTREFNLFQDLKASRTIFNCGVPLVQIPCMGVASHIKTTVPELKSYLSESKIGKYLVDIVSDYASATDSATAWSKVIWDISTIGYLINEDWVDTNLVHSPILNENFTWSFDNSRHFIKVAYNLDRDKIFGDLFNKLNQ